MHDAGSPDGTTRRARLAGPVAVVGCGAACAVLVLVCAGLAVLRTWWPPGAAPPSPAPPPVEVEQARVLAEGADGADELVAAVRRALSSGAGAALAWPERCDVAAREALAAAARTRLDGPLRVSPAAAVLEARQRVVPVAADGREGPMVELVLERAPGEAWRLAAVLLADR